MAKTELENQIDDLQEKIAQCHHSINRFAVHGVRTVDEQVTMDRFIYMKNFNEDKLRKLQSQLPRR